MTRAPFSWKPLARRVAKRTELTRAVVHAILMNGERVRVRCFVADFRLYIHRARSRPDSRGTVKQNQGENSST